MRVLLLALDLGMGVPLVLFATGGGSLLPKSGDWMLAVRNNCRFYFAFKIRGNAVLIDAAATLKNTKPNQYGCA